MSEKLDQLNKLYAEIDDLHRAAAILEWDQQAYMPPGGARPRAAQLATLARIAHEQFTSDRMGYLLDSLEKELGDQPYDDDNLSIVRVLRRDYNKAVRLPAAFVSELAEARGLATS